MGHSSVLPEECEKETHQKEKRQTPIDRDANGRRYRAPVKRMY